MRPAQARHDSESVYLDALLDALPPLHWKVRRNVAALLARRLARLAQWRREGAGVPSLPLLLGDVLVRLEVELTELEDGLDHLTRRYAEARTSEERLAVLTAHIEETVEDRRERRKDLRALGRWMGLDALRERFEKRRHALRVQEETALRCIAGLLRIPSGNAEADAELTSLGPALLNRAVGSPRPQNQLAALEALRELLARVPATLSTLPDMGVALTGLVGNPEAGPFLQAEALRVLLAISPTAARLLLRRRLEGPYPSRRDFLFRRAALEHAASLLPSDELLPLLTEVARTDPSEWVRLGLCELLVQRPERAPLLRRLAGLEPGAPEESFRVRLGAVLAASTVLARGLPSPEACGQLLVDVLRAESHALVLRATCEQTGALAETLGRDGLGEALTPLREALSTLRARKDVSGPVLEAAAAAGQVLVRVEDPARHAWTLHLARVVRDMRPGGKTRVTFHPPPPGLPPLPEEPAWLGAILADLSHGGEGLYARRGKRTLTLWRGDRFGRRLWRLWHEVRRPAPNKRQAFRHTVGRILPGPLRAHPGRLDEITETLVPGERVHVASQGGWGRHLPTVDDLLDLPLGSTERVHLFSSHGTTTLAPPASLGRRLRNRLRLSRDYQRLATLRLTSLNGNEPRERRRYVEQVERELGVAVQFSPYQPGESAPAPVASLFGGPGEQDAKRHSLAALGGLWGTNWLAQVSDRLVESQGYFFGASGNGIGALGLFTAGVFTLFLGQAYHQRQAIQRAREALPLCIGGWGTRGKSGTERLKAALFTGMGFDVFAKTTGSEAMFVHSAPGGAPSEFFIFRPYDKATIWEQRDMLELGVRLGTEVFLWECMALQPNFVELLQNDWMHDDLATLTNAYPDHEDIQGPAGINVASVITQFIPEGGTVVTTEDHFLPLFQQVARERGATLLHSPHWEAELIPEELLALFPYREHPRNMALVATLAEQLGVPRAQALALMAEHVQPEIGVLKVFPPARVRGRVLTFINGHSANERTGFLNNWKRTGLDAVDPDAHPERAVVTVINNRWDRVARSEVFARIMVEDASADRHVLIGTNLEGLQKYVRDAVEQALARTEVVAPEDLAPGATSLAEERLARELARLKIPRPEPTVFLERLARYARGAGLTLSATPALSAAVEAALSASDETFEVARVREQLASQVGPLLDASLQPGPADEDAALPEVLAPASAQEVREHALYLLARMGVSARLRRALPTPGDTGSAEARIAAFHAHFRGAWRALFLEQLVPVHDSHATGDQVVDACARAVPPGMQVSIMGAQNIKGTGLDWVYRWLALDRVQGALETLRTGTPEARRRAMETLEGFEDWGLVDAGLARAVLPRLVETAGFPEETERLRRLAERARTTHAAKLGALQHTRSGGRMEQVARTFEKVFDYLDSVERRRMSEQLLSDLVAGRVSHTRASLEMRKLYERQKGGWLRESFRPLLELLSPVSLPRRQVPQLEAAPEPARQEVFGQPLTPSRAPSVAVPAPQARNTVAPADAGTVRVAEPKQPAPGTSPRQPAQAADSSSPEKVEPES